MSITIFIVNLIYCDFLSRYNNAWCECVYQFHLITEVRKLLLQRQYSRRRHGVIGAAVAVTCIPRTLWPHRTWHHILALTHTTHDQPYKLIRQIIGSLFKFPYVGPLNIPLIHLFLFFIFGINNILFVIQ